MKDSSKLPKSPEMIRDLFERSYWALTINALEPINTTEIYCQEDIEILVDQLREFLNG